MLRPQALKNPIHRIAIVGGGPSALFLLQNFLESRLEGAEVLILEKGASLGAGMPYSAAGAGREHATNVSGNEVPRLPIPLVEWAKSRSDEELGFFGLLRERLSEYKVVPRLFFGRYLEDQFRILVEEARQRGLKVHIQQNTTVLDISHEDAEHVFALQDSQGTTIPADAVVLSIGHHWPRLCEGRIAGYYDSPYPPSKLSRQFNHPIALLGSSLTAIDAVRTLARSNGRFTREAGNQLSFAPSPESPDFRVVMFSRQGILPGIRFHLEDPQLSKASLLSEAALHVHRAENAGFISLDFVFEKDFKEQIRVHEPEWYRQIAGMGLESFVAAMLQDIQKKEPFDELRSEYREACQSIRNRRSILWREKLALLSFALGFPAKYFSAEDRLRVEKVLMPLIAHVVAFVPQVSCEEMLALQAAGRLELVALGAGEAVPRPDGGATISLSSSDGDIRHDFETFIDCTGQPALAFEQFPFASLVRSGLVAPAWLQFRDPANASEVSPEKAVLLRTDEAGKLFLKVSGVAIGDDYQARDVRGALNRRLFVMTPSLISGVRPDFSGLDFCEDAAKRVTRVLMEELTASGVEANGRAKTVKRQCGLGGAMRRRHFVP